MLGSIAGDIIGSVYERHSITIKRFPLFIQFSHLAAATVMMVATAHCLLNGTGYAETYRPFGKLDHAVPDGTLRTNGWPFGVIVTEIVSGSSPDNYKSDSN